MAKELGRSLMGSFQRVKQVNYAKKKKQKKKKRKKKKKQNNNNNNNKKGGTVRKWRSGYEKK